MGGSFPGSRALPLSVIPAVALFPKSNRGQISSLTPSSVLGMALPPRLMCFLKHGNQNQFSFKDEAQGDGLVFFFFN